MTDDFGSLRELDVQRLSAPKHSGLGEIEFKLLVDKAGALFVRMVGNSRSGTFADLAFKLSYLQAMINTGVSDFVGIGKDGSETVVADNNNKAFLRSIVRQLLPPS